MSDYQEQVRFQMPSPSKLFTPAVTVILALMVISLLLTIFTGGFVIDLFGLSKQGLTRGMIWQIVTYSLISSGPMQLVFNGLAVLFLGSMIERQWRTMSFVFLWVVVSGICGLAWILLTALMGSGAVAVGANACIYGMLGTFGILFRRRQFFMFFATIETKYLVWIMESKWSHVFCDCFRLVRRRKEVPRISIQTVDGSGIKTVTPESIVAKVSGLTIS